MSKQSPMFRSYDDPRVLVIGKDAVTLALVTEEVRAAGIDVRGMTPADADGSLTGPFDLVAFGGAITHEQRLSLVQEARFHNPDVRFVRVYAPFAATQIVTAARNTGQTAVDLAA